MMGTSSEEIQLKLADLRQAIGYEKHHRYTDVQGRKKTFSAFVRETIQSLQHLPIWGEESRISGFIQQFQHYRFMDLSTRMTTIENLEALLEQSRNPGQPHHKTVLKEAEGEQSPLALHEAEVQYLKGVGPRLAQVLGLVGIKTVEDLLYYFPRRYLDYQNRLKIRDLQEGQEVTILGSIHTVNAYQPPNKNVSVLNITVVDETGQLGATWFYGKANRAVLETYKSRFPKGTEVMLSGKVKWDRFKGRYVMDRPEVEILSYQDGTDSEEPSSLHAGRIVPVYPLVEGLNVKFLRKAIHQGLQAYLPFLVDPLPGELKKRYSLIDLQEALQHIHFPETTAHYESARKRLVFDELFYLQTRLALMRQQYKQHVQGLSLKRQADGLIDRFLKNLSFQLTGAQLRVFEEICSDLASPEPMYRLLQGDVGSGKTVVAALTLLMAVENGFQGALMAPTEILAEQHYRRFIEWLTPLGIKVGLVVGAAKAKERRELHQGLLNGQIHLAIGTHALIQDDVEFKNLGVVVVDEQHRFGVRQRTLLKAKGNHPEMLTMTATPIPRSLAMTLHGDLDVSVLDELPHGRTPIKTVLLQSRQQQQAHQLIRQEVIKGRQTYIVFPLIEESETLSAKAATTEAERLQAEVFPEYKIGLLHGKLKPEEKDQVMLDFVRGETQILVSTTVVEVGVDVPNATVMIIENADRFGLSQLHQLRGRVGRSSHQSYCILVCDSRGEDTVQRMQTLVDSEDGFVIAEKDLEFRGPGEFLGTRQSGLPDFILADLIHDRSILEMAREAAGQVVQDPQFLLTHPDLQQLIVHKTQETFSVLGAG